DGEFEAKPGSSPFGVVARLLNGSCRPASRTGSLGHLLTVDLFGRTTASDWLLQVSFVGWATASTESCQSSAAQADGCCTSEAARRGQLTG
ncbi:MAG TPA: hypothetical protein VIY30_16710, partial [Burkholderiaceae bacterium]